MGNALVTNSTTLDLCAAEKSVTKSHLAGLMFVGGVDVVVMFRHRIFY